MSAASNPVKFLQVLPIVLQHSSDDISPKTLCSLLQISGTCRQLLRQSSANCSIVSTMGLPALGTLLGFSRFASWLPTAAGLISRLDLSSVPETDSLCHMEVMQHLLLLALQAAAAAGPSTAATAAASKTPAGALPLQLEHISLGRLASPAVVGALASTHVQHLEIELYSSFPPALCPAIGCLQSLEQLTVRVKGIAGRSRGAVLQAMQGLVVGLGQLQHLTSLHLQPVDFKCFQQLPASLQVLHMHGYSAEQPPADSTAAVDLRYLTALQKLTVGVQRSTPASELQLRLLPQLTTLAARGAVHVLGAHGVREVEADFVNTTSWGILQCLPKQQQPCELRLMLGEQSISPEAAHALQLCTSLTSLHIHPGPSADKDVMLGQYIQKLTNLVDFTLCMGEQKQQDMFQLSALTRLTDLTLDTPLDDAAAVGVVCALTNLRRLSISTDGLRTTAVLSAAARLTGLQSLALENGSSQPSNLCREQMTPAVLEQLLALTQLTRLTLPVNETSRQVWQSFKAAMLGVNCSCW